MSRLGPEDAWPIHPRKEARDALFEARRQRWTLIEFSAHVFGKIQCLVHTDPACEVTIFSTGRGDKSGAVTAKIVRDKLRGCRNREGGNEPVPPADPHGALVRAERLTEAAERLQMSERLRSQSEDRLARAEDATDDEAGERLLEEAYVADAGASVEDRAAWHDAHRFGLGEPWPPSEGAAELKEAALEQLEIARNGSLAVDDPEDFKARLSLLEQRLSADV
jgi:hypothetical protein